MTFTPGQPVLGAVYVEDAPGRAWALAAFLVGVFAVPVGLLPLWGAIPAAVAVLLAIVALARRQSKGPAITGMVLGVLAALTSVALWLGYITNPIDFDLLGFSPTDTVGATPSATTSGAAPAAELSAQPTLDPSAAPSVTAFGDPGSLGNPFPWGTQVSGPDWIVTVNSLDQDGNDTVAAGNALNDPPAAGHHYEVVNYTVTYTGTGSGSRLEVSTELVTSTGQVINATDRPTSLQDSIDFEPLEPGQSATGSMAFHVPDGATVVAFRITPGFFEDAVHVATP